MSISINVSSAPAIASKDDLKAWVAEEADRDLTEVTASGTLSDNMDKWILMAEARFNRDIRVPDMESTVTWSVSTEDAFLPDDYLSMRAIYEHGSPDEPLRATSPSSIRQEFDGTPGQPQEYMLVSGGIRFIPPPDATYLMTMDYYSRIEGLSVVNPSNWLLQKHPDAYVAGVLFYYYRWSKDRQSAIDADALCNEIIGKINLSAQLDRYGAGPISRSTSVQVSGARC